MLKELLKEKQARVSEINDLIENSEDIVEVKNLGREKRSLEKDITTLTNATVETRSFNPMSTMGTYEVGTEVEEDPLATMEYRSQFMNYVQKGVRGDKLQFRANEFGQASDLGVLLPTTVVQSIQKELEGVYGTLYAKVRKLNVKGGLKFPLGAFSATFNRITETTVSETQNAGGVTGYVEFSYNMGEIRVAQTLLQAVLSVPVFEAELAKVIVKAYLKAMDLEIINGNPANNQMEGILTEAAKADSRIKNVVEFNEEEIGDWSVWETKLFAEIPLELENINAEFVMAKQTYVSNLVTMQDINGQPIKKAGYDVTDRQHKFNEYPVHRVEKAIFKDFNSCAVGEYFGMFWLPEEAYAINTNLEFYVQRYFDHATNQWIDKAIVINDGKVLDPKYIYLLKKSAVSA